MLTAVIAGALDPKSVKRGIRLHVLLSVTTGVLDLVLMSAVN